MYVTLFTKPINPCFPLKSYLPKISVVKNFTFTKVKRRRRASSKTTLFSSDRKQPVTSFMGILATSTHQKWDLFIEGLPSLKGYVSFSFREGIWREKSWLWRFLRSLLTNSGEFMRLSRNSIKKKNGNEIYKYNLVGGWTNPSENICQIGSFPQVGMKIFLFLKPPPGINIIHLLLWKPVSWLCSFEKNRFPYDWKASCLCRKGWLTKESWKIYENLHPKKTCVFFLHPKKKCPSHERIGESCWKIPPNS